jgi:hypothetical protein
MVIMAAVALTGRLAGAKERSIAVIVHPDNQTDDLTVETLQMFFLKQRSKWPDDRPLIVLNFKAKHSLRIAFDRIVLKLRPDQAAAYWIDRRIRGKGHPPRSLNSSLLIQRIVARNPETIAYVPADEVGEKVKVVAVGGRLPGDQGYLLRTGDEP